MISNVSLCCQSSFKGTNITADNLAKVLKCSKNGPTQPTQVWKLLFQKTSPVLHAALETFSTMVYLFACTAYPFPDRHCQFVLNFLQVGNMSFPSLSTALDALEEVQIATFNSRQLQNETFIENWFQNIIRPLLSFPSRNFLYCLSSRDFSCSSYHSV